MIDKMTSIFCRVFFGIAALMLIVAILDRFLGLFGWRLSLAYQPGRIIEFSAMMMTFVSALLLRQIRESLKSK